MRLADTGVSVANRPNSAIASVALLQRRGVLDDAQADQTSPASIPSHRGRSNRPIPHSPASRTARASRCWIFPQKARTLLRIRLKSYTVSASGAMRISMIAARRMRECCLCRDGAKGSARPRPRQQRRHAPANGRVHRPDAPSRGGPALPHGGGYRTASQKYKQRSEDLFRQRGY